MCGPNLTAFVGCIGVKSLCCADDHGVHESSLCKVQRSRPSSSMQLKADMSIVDKATGWSRHTFYSIKASPKELSRGSGLEGLGVGGMCCRVTFQLHKLPKGRV